MRAKSILLTITSATIAIATTAGCLLELSPVDHWCGEGWEGQIQGADTFNTLGEDWPIPTSATKFHQCMTMKEDFLLTEADDQNAAYNALYAAFVAGSEAECELKGPNYIQSGTFDYTTCDQVDETGSGVTSSVAYDDTCWEAGGAAEFEECWDDYYDCDTGGTGEGGWNCNDDPDTSAAGFENLSTLITCTSSPDECTIDVDFLTQWWYGPDAIDDDGSRLVRHEDATGAPDGWEVEGVSTGNLADELGFEDGDIITKINDVDCLDVEDAIAIYLDETEGTADIVLDIDYTRGRESKSIEITIERN